MPPTMHDLGQTYADTAMAEPTAPEQEKHYPILHGLTSEQLPGLEHYEAGDEVELTFLGVIKTKTVDADETDGKPTDGKPKKESIDVKLIEGACVHHGDYKLAEETGQTVKDIRARKAKT